MLKKYVWLTLATLFFAFQMFVGSATAAESDEAMHTVPLNSQGETIVLSREQLKDGRRLFNFACGMCHINGITKTDPNIDLAKSTLALATPPRDNVESLVDYLKNPTTYDGARSIAELHPSMKGAEFFPKMRNLTDGDLTAIAGHVLVQHNLLGDERWGAGKVGF